MDEKDCKLLKCLQEALNRGIALSIEAEEVGLTDYHGGHIFAKIAYKELCKVRESAGYLPARLARVLHLPASLMANHLEERFGVE